ncbi:MAG: 3-methylornithine--L-lysine ligase PylC [bacterium]|nr:3-methylornithine--L-lysine ligase PylC [bacterium]
MLVAVVGGKLQGLEATYLCQKAGWEVLLIDKVADTPASALCDYFVLADILTENPFKGREKEIGLVVPALENEDVLGVLEGMCYALELPLVFDAEAYAISSSKQESDRLFARLGVPAPQPWPGCGFPVVAKPSGGSGSEGVRIFYTMEQLKKQFPSFTGEVPGGWVFQEYLETAESGQYPSYSIEVVGRPGAYSVLQVTDLEMDDGYDCKRVTAPTRLEAGEVVRFEEIALEIAEAIGLCGIMDVEAILHEGELKVLEIDARLPSQTPTAVYWSDGRNMLEMLGACFGKGVPGYTGDLSREEKGVVFEHIRVCDGEIEVCGEHIMAGVGPLLLQRDFFGADEAITNYRAGCREWVATLIVSGKSRQDALEKGKRVLENIEKSVPGEINTSK